MNRLQTEIESPTNITRYQKSLGLTLLSTLLLSLFSSSAFANRPAMEDRSSFSNEVIENVNEPQPEASSEMRPATPAETPSSVDLMMQNPQPQPQQQITGGVVQLPARELQVGETLQIQLLDYPRRGMSMDKVQHQYGQPITRFDSVGTPPITRWTYNDRVVYFEYSTVLHVVAR